MTMITQRPSMAEILQTIALLQKRRKRRRVLITLGVIVFVIAALAFAASQTVAVPVRYQGHAMNDTLADQELLLVNTWKKAPVQSAIVRCKLRDPEGGQLIRRIAAVAGQHIVIDAVTGAVKVDDKDFDAGLGVTPALGNLDTPQDLTVPEGKVYLLGDNRIESFDSRSSQIGLVDVSLIEGTVWGALSPSIRKIP